MAKEPAKVVHDPKEGSIRLRIFKALISIEHYSPTAGLSSEEIVAKCGVQHSAHNARNVLLDEVTKGRIARGMIPSDGSRPLYGYVLTKRGRKAFLAGEIDKRSSCGRGLGKPWTSAMKKKVLAGIKKHHGG